MTRKVYRAPVNLGVRGVGVGAVGVGLTLVAVSIVAAVNLPSWLRSVLLVLLGAAALVFLVLLTVGVFRACGWSSRLVLDDDGFTNATGPKAGPRRGYWRDVRKVQADGSVVSVDLSNGSQSIIRTSNLEVDARQLAQELRARLNTSHRYRPVPSPKSAD